MYLSIYLCTWKALDGGAQARSGGPISPAACIPTIHPSIYLSIYIYLSIDTICPSIFIYNIQLPGRLWMAGRKRAAEAQFRPPRAFRLSIHLSIYIDLSIDTICPSIFIYNIQLPGRLWMARRKRAAEAQFRPPRTFRLSIHLSIYIDLSIDTIYPSIFIYNIKLPGRLWTAGRKQAAEARFRPPRTFR